MWMLPKLPVLGYFLGFGLGLPGLPGLCQLIIRPPLCSLVTSVDYAVLQCSQ